MSTNDRSFSRRDVLKLGSTLVLIPGCAADQVSGLDGGLPGPEGELLADVIQWWEPSHAAGIGYDAANDQENLAATGAGCSIDEAAFGSLSGWDMDGTAHMSGELAGEPWDRISDDFALVVMVKPDTLGTTQVVCSNGADNAGQPGFNVQISTGTVRVEIADGDAENGANLRVRSLAAGESNVLVINLGFTPGTLTRVFENGITRLDSARAVADLTTGIRLPLTPHWSNAAFGSLRPESSVLPFAGKLRVGVINRHVTFEEAHFLTNYFQGRSFVEVARHSWAADPVKYVWMGLPGDTSIPISVRTDDEVVVRGVDASGTDVYSSGLLSPTKGIVKTTVTGLTPAGSYSIRVDNSAGQESQYGAEFMTAPAGAAFSYRFAFGNCARVESSKNVFVDLGMHAEDWGGTVLFFQHLGDLHYQDITANDPSLFRSAYETVFTKPDGFHAQRFSWERLPMLYTWSDHDVGTNDNDSTNNAALPAAQQAYREVVPHEPLPDAEAIYYSYVVGRIRFIVMDLRSEKIRAASVMMSAAQMQWVKDEVTAAKVNQQVACLVSEAFWQLGGGTLQYWEAFPAQREEIWEHIEAEAMGGSVFTLCGDQHMIGLDTGVNHAFDTDGSTPIPCAVAGPLDHDFRQEKGMWDTFSGTESNGAFGIVDVADAGSATIGLTITIRADGADVATMRITLAVP